MIVRLTAAPTALCSGVAWAFASCDFLRFKQCAAEAFCESHSRNAHNDWIHAEGLLALGISACAGTVLLAARHWLRPSATAMAMLGCLALGGLYMLCSGVARPIVLFPDCNPRSLLAVVILASALGLLLPSMQKRGGRGRETSQPWEADPGQHEEVP